MSGLGQRIGEATRSIVDFLRSAKEQYEGANRFGRVRFWLLLGIVADLCAVALVYISVGSSSLAVQVWHVPGFPTGTIMVRNREGAPLSDVRVRVDDRFEAVVPSLRDGVTGLHLRRDFRDADAQTPSRGYIPHSAEVQVDGAVVRFELQAGP